MTQKIIDFGKSLTHYIFTAVFAAIGVYIGLKINIAEMQKDIEYTKYKTECNSAYIEEIKPNISILSYMHNLGIRSKATNDHSHKQEGLKYE